LWAGEDLQAGEKETGKKRRTGMRIAPRSDFAG
jgi:hypothetical protein